MTSYNEHVQRQQDGPGYLETNDVDNSNNKNNYDEDGHRRAADDGMTEPTIQHFPSGQTCPFVCRHRISGNIWTCCGAPFWLRHWMSVLVGMVVILILLVAITASITSQQDEVNIPALGYDRNSFAVAAHSNHSVVIVGAGAAGLLAGYALSFVGMEKIQILEARSEFGGRTRQLDNFVDTVPLDLGAEWIHVQPNVLQRLVLPFNDDNNNNLAPQTPTTIRYQPQTIGVHINNKVMHRNWFRWFYAETKFYNTTWWSYLADFIVQPYLQDKIQRNSAVQLIDYTYPNKIRLVTTTGDEYYADTVIVAAPVKILQNQASITFDPPVPTWKQDAWDTESH
jgi:hypothetical protein